MRNYLKEQRTITLMNSSLKVQSIKVKVTIELSLIDSFPDLHYPAMIRETLEIIHVMNTIVYFLVTNEISNLIYQVSYFFLKRGSYEEEIFFIVFICAIICFLGFVLIHRQKYNFYLFIGDVKTAIFLTGMLLFLTPVLKSLTVTYHDNTIIMFVVCKNDKHLIYFSLCDTTFDSL